MKNKRDKVVERGNKEISKEKEQKRWSRKERRLGR